MPPSATERVLARLFRPFAKVEPNESIKAAILTFTVFLLLTGYYLLKTAREPLILLGSGAEVKSYASAGQALLFVVVLRAYSSLARRFGRMKLLAIVYLFFFSNLLVFAALVQAGAQIGIPFYLWVGIFNYTAIAQFWAFANDVHTPEQGKRIFAILGIGSSVGAVAGARIAKSLASLGPAGLMIGAAIILILCLGLLAWVERRSSPADTSPKEPAKDAPVLGGAALSLLLRDRYLILVSGLTLLLNWVNANGEYLLDRSLLASVAEAQTHGQSASTFIAAFKADYFAWVNLVGVLIQLFLVSRILERLGVARALYFLPLASLIGYSLVFVFPVLTFIRLAKITENSLDYSLENTARQALFLVTNRAEKYVGKTVVDTLFVRVGDMLSALVVWISTRLEISTRAFAGLSIVLIAGWLMLVFAVGREHARRAEDESAIPPGEPLPST